MRAVESQCVRGWFCYLPKDKIQAVAFDIPHMAILAFTTHVEGLDTTTPALPFGGMIPLPLFMPPPPVERL